MIQRSPMLQGHINVPILLSILVVTSAELVILSVSDGAAAMPSLRADTVHKTGAARHAFIGH